ncbi:MAG: DUF3881 family protein [Lachnospiraceae bacterium]|nr:DUF3881 family protein [Lachnospiraceae bacterium]
MHRFLRAIGFSNLTERKELKELLQNIVRKARDRQYVSREDRTTLGEFSEIFGDDIGITVCGEFDDENEFFFDHYFPYLRSHLISSTEDITVEKQAGNEAYLGVCDDMKMGITLIFYLQNIVPYVKAQGEGRLPIRGTTLSLSALSDGGTILMPLSKDEREKDSIKKKSKDRRTLLKEARAGNEEAIETLTLGDMDLYSQVSRKIQKSDLYTVVDTSFMPYGVECDQYSLIGEIQALRKVENIMTGEGIYILTLLCNEMEIDLCINEKDLYGEPEVGRRFKGNIWLQGCIHGEGLDQ